MTEACAERTLFQCEYEYPAFGNCNMDKFIIGFAENMLAGYTQFQMIFNDGSMSSSKNHYNDDDWNQRKIDKALWGKLNRVEVFYCKDNARMVGISMTSDDGDVNLESEDLAAGEFEDSDKFGSRVISLKKGEKLIGFRSRQLGDKEGDYSVQFVKGIPK